MSRVIFGVVFVVTGDAEGHRWLYQGEAVGWAGSEHLEFVFGADRVEAVVFDGIPLGPDDPRLDWFALVGAACDGGPFPPDFRFSPFDRRPLDRRAPSPPFGSPFNLGNGFAEVVRNGVPMRAAAGLRTRRGLRTMQFAKAHSDFFACGATPVLHAASDEGVIEWFATGDLETRGPDEPLVGHGYGAPLGRLSPRHRRGIAAGRVGFGTVAEERPVWVRATPFGAERQARAVCPCDRGLAAPSVGHGGFVWPVIAEGRMKVAERADAVDAAWRFHPVADHDGEPPLAPPCRLEGDVVVWIGEDGYLIGRDADWRWRSWSGGFRALPQHRPHLDVQGNAWQFGTDPTGYAFAKLSSGRQDLAPTTGRHVGGVRFTIQGSDFLDRPAQDDRRRRTLPAIDGKTAVPILNFEDGAVLALSNLPANAVPEDYFSPRGGTTASYVCRFLSFADLSLVDLGAGMMSWTQPRDLHAFVFADHLFLTSSWEKRCVVLSA